MELQKEELVSLISTVVKETITQLGLGKAVENANPKTDIKEKSAYQKTEQLLYKVWCA